MKKISPQKTVKAEDINKQSKLSPPKYVYPYKQQDYSYEGQDLQYSYDYHGEKQGNYFSPSSYQWNDRYQDQQTNPRSYRHNPPKENPRYRLEQQQQHYAQLPPYGGAYPHIMAPNSRGSLGGRPPYREQGYDVGYYSSSSKMIPGMMQQPIYPPAMYPQPHNYRHSPPIKQHNPMPVPVVQDFSPPPRERYGGLPPSDPRELGAMMCGYAPPYGGN